jgi:ATP-dependent protease ClpP protease subunit
VLGVPQTYRYFHDMQERIADFICRHSRISKEKLEELMMTPDKLATDVGSIIDGHEAVKYGLIGAVGGLDTALDALHAMIDEKNGKKC